jgi:hypothetical protein
MTRRLVFLIAILLIVAMVGSALTTAPGSKAPAKTKTAKGKAGAASNAKAEPKAKQAPGDQPQADSIASGERRPRVGLLSSASYPLLATSRAA